jgi:hypothetical protein
LISVSRCGPGETTLPNSASGITAACDGIRVTPLPGSYPSPLTVTAQSCDGSPIKASWRLGASDAPMPRISTWEGVVTFWRGGTEAEGAPRVTMTATFRRPTTVEMTFNSQLFRYDVAP